MQVASYSFQPVTALQDLLRNTPEYSEKELHKFSITNEPTEQPQ